MTLADKRSSFLLAARDQLEASDEMRTLLMTAYCQVQFELPLKRDDGSMAIYRGECALFDIPFGGARVASIAIAVTCPLLNSKL